MKSWYRVAKSVVEEHSYKHVDVTTNEEVPKETRNSQILDATTANMLIQVYEALGGANREKFSTLPIIKAVNLGWKLCR